MSHCARCNCDGNSHVSHRLKTGPNGKLYCFACWGRDWDSEFDQQCRDTECDFLSFIKPENRDEKTQAIIAAREAYNAKVAGLKRELAHAEKMWRLRLNEIEALPL